MMNKHNKATDPQPNIVGLRKQVLLQLYEAQAHEHFKDSGQMQNIPKTGKFHQR